MKTKSQPLRTCVGCRHRSIQAELLRMVAAKNDGGISVVVDVHHRMTGRGAWLHPSRSCLALALKRRAFNRAFRGAVDTDAVELYFNAAELRRPIAGAPEQPSNLKAGRNEDGNPMSTQR